MIVFVLFGEIRQNEPHIQAIYTTRELAEKENSWGYYYIEEHEVYGKKDNI